MDEKRPRLQPASVEALVGNAHGDIEEVQRLLDAEPALENAAWDWGGGDWETALGAAAHTGRRDVAELLISRGARIAGPSQDRTSASRARPTTASTRLIR